MFKKKDFIILIIIALIITGGFIFNNFYFNQDNLFVQIRINNQIYQRLPLSIDQTVDIKDKTTVIIKDRHVHVENSNCPDKLCQKQGSIEKNGEQIICLPNKIVIEIVSDQIKDIDAIAS